MEEVGVVGCTFTDSFIVPLRALARPWFFPLWVFHVNLGVRLSGCCVCSVRDCILLPPFFPNKWYQSRWCSVIDVQDHELKV